MSVTVPGCRTRTRPGPGRLTGLAGRSRGTGRRGRSSTCRSQHRALLLGGLGGHGRPSDGPRLQPRCGNDASKPVGGVAVIRRHVVTPGATQEGLAVCPRSATNHPMPVLGRRSPGRRRWPAEVLGRFALAVRVVVPVVPVRAHSLTLPAMWCAPDEVAFFCVTGTGLPAARPDLLSHASNRSPIAFRGE